MMMVKDETPQLQVVARMSLSKNKKNSDEKKHREKNEQFYVIYIFKSVCPNCVVYEYTTLHTQIFYVDVLPKITRKHFHSSKIVFP